MNASNIIRPPKRFTTEYLGTLGIQSYGKDNLYPQRMYDLIQNSPTGASCLERYMTFIEGNGLRDTAFSEYVVNRRGETVDDIFSLIARDMAYYHGFALHVNYNMALRIVELQHIPFQDCRLEEEDDSGQIISAAIHPDWTGQKTRRGKKQTVDKAHVRRVNLFNPIPQVLMAQIDAAGGIENYSGQVLWFSMDGKNQYPKPVYDKVVTNLSTDEGLDNVKYRNVRNGFMHSGMFIHKKGAGLAEYDEQGQQIPAKQDSELTQILDEFQGDVNCGSIMEISLNSEEDRPEFITVEGTNYDAKFTVTEQSITERIYSAFGQEPWYSFRVGKLGFSGNLLKEVYEYYNSYVAKERRAISRSLKRIFECWHETANAKGDYEIEPLVYISTETGNDAAFIDD